MSQRGVNVMEERNLRKTRVGKVVSNKMDKTIVVFDSNNDGLVHFVAYNLTDSGLSEVSFDCFAHDIYSSLRLIQQPFC